MRRIAAALLCVAVLAGCSGQEGSGAGTAGFQQGDGTVTVVPAGQRQAAPVLRGKTLDGKTISTADYQGKIIVLNVWGSWCAPCRAEAPKLKQAAQQMRDVQFIGINTRDLDPAPARAFVRTFELDFPQLYDPNGTLLLGFGKLSPAAIPSTVIVDEQGRIAGRVLGEVSTSTLVGMVEEVRRA